MHTLSTVHQINNPNKNDMGYFFVFLFILNILNVWDLYDQKKKTTDYIHSSRGDDSKDRSQSKIQKAE